MGRPPPFPSRSFPKPLSLQQLLLPPQPFSQGLLLLSQLLSQRSLLRPQLSSQQLSLLCFPPVEPLPSLPHPLCVGLLLLLSLRLTLLLLRLPPLPLLPLLPLLLRLSFLRHKVRVSESLPSRAYPLLSERAAQGLCQSALLSVLVVLPLHTVLLCRSELS